jgi:membrane-associated phospholipid phosphatase
MTWLKYLLDGSIMEQIDIAVVRFLNGFAMQWTTFDRIVIDILQMSTFKMMPLICVVIWLWFSDEAGGTRHKALFNGLLGGLLALLITRGLQNFLPYRSRPSLTAALDFVMPAGAYPNYGSSFPSDTAGLAFAVVLGIWWASRRLGVAAFAWAVLVVCFPRLYGGYHYLSDMLAGGLIGMACTYACMRLAALSGPLYDATLRLSKNHRPWFFVLAFIVAYQSTDYYLDVRKVAEQVLFKLGFKQEKYQHLQRQEAERRGQCNSDNAAALPVQPP